MISLFKKTVLTVTMLGCAFGAQAEEKKAASSTVAGLATGAIAAGAAVATFGAVGTVAKLNTDAIIKDFAPSCANQFLSTAPYAWLMVPGVLVALAGAAYCCKSAKGIGKKVRSLLGSSTALTGGILLTAGCLVYLAMEKQRVIANTEASPELMKNLKNIMNDIKEGKDVATRIANLPEAGRDVCWYAKYNQKPPTMQSINDWTLSSLVAGIAGGFAAICGWVLQPKDDSKEQQA